FHGLRKCGRITSTNSYRCTYLRKTQSNGTPNTATAASNQRHGSGQRGNSGICSICPTYQRNENSSSLVKLFLCETHRIIIAHRRAWARGIIREAKEEWQASETIFQCKKLLQGKRLADAGLLPYNPKVFRMRTSVAALRSTRFPVVVFRGAPEKIQA